MEYNGIGLAHFISKKKSTKICGSLGTEIALSKGVPVFDLIKVDPNVGNAIPRSNKRRLVRRLIRLHPELD